MSDLGNREVFAENLKRMMAEKEMLRPDLAKVLDVSYSTVNDWYNAKTYPRIDMIEAMANYFRVDKSALIEHHKEDSSPHRKYLMDKIANATPDQIKKLDRLWDIIVEEDERNT